MWALLLLGCERAPTSVPPGRACADADARTRAIALTSTIARGEVDPCAVLEGTPIDIEVRDALVETDERRRETLTGHAALSARLGTLAHVGIAHDGALRCYGDCCDVQHQGMKPGPLYLRRMCFAYGKHLSSIVFVEVR